MFVSHCLISCTHYYSTCFTVLPAALVSLHQSSDSHACWHSLKKKGAFDCVLSHCPCSSNPSHTHTHTTSIRRTEPFLYTPLVPPSWVRNVVRALRKCRWALGIWGGEEEMGWNIPSSHQQPTPDYLLHLQHTHTSLAAVCHTQTACIQCLCVSECVCVCVNVHCTMWGGVEGYQWRGVEQGFQLWVHQSVRMVQRFSLRRQYSKVSLKHTDLFSH